MKKLEDVNKGYTLSITNKIGILKILTDLALKEAELLWKRYSTMLIASTGLVGILTFSLKEKLIQLTIGCSLMGIIFAITWLYIIKLSQFYYNRWQFDADDLIRNDINLSKIVRGRIDSQVPPPKKSMPVHMQK
jgi:hypothetical protein